MYSPRVRFIPLLTAVLALTLGLSACGNKAAKPASPSVSAAPSSVEVDSNTGKVTVDIPPKRVAAFDNRSFRLLDSWGVKLKVGSVSLMRPDLSYKTDKDVLNTGTHGEPNLELVVAADPDLVVGGQRYTEYHDQIMKLVPKAKLVDFTPRDGKDFGAELKRQVTELGKIFGKDAEAKSLIEDFDKAIARVKAAYDPKQKVLGVVTSGGKVNYAAPTKGRSVGPAFDMLGLTPALQVGEASSNHEGDDISVEAIAKSNPDWILVMDRDAGVSGVNNKAYRPAHELIKESAALQRVTAVQKSQIIYMPKYTYLDEGLVTYTEFFNSIAEAMEKAKKG